MVLCLRIEEYAFTVIIIIGDFSSFGSSSIVVGIRCVCVFFGVCRFCSVTCNRILKLYGKCTICFNMMRVYVNLVSVNANANANVIVADAMYAQTRHR